jgi:hypothetical protein
MLPLPPSARPPAAPALAAGTAPSVQQRPTGDGQRGGVHHAAGPDAPPAKRPRVEPSAPPTAAPVTAPPARPKAVATAAAAARGRALEAEVRAQPALVGSAMARQPVQLLDVLTGGLEDPAELEALEALLREVERLAAGADVDTAAASYEVVELCSGTEASGEEEEEEQPRVWELPEVQPEEQPGGRQREREQELRRRSGPGAAAQGVAPSTAAAAAALPPSVAPASAVSTSPGFHQQQQQQQQQQQPAARPAPSSRPPPPVILHVDLDAYYVQVSVARCTR